MKILLVAINSKYIHSCLAVYSLKAYADKYSEKVLEGECEILVKEYTINQNLSDILADIYAQKADVVAFSCYIWNIVYVRQIASNLKKISPCIRIWAGGPEVSYDPDNAADNAVFDVIIRGEGEAPFTELIDKGYLEDNDRKPLDMDTIPFAYGEGSCVSMDDLENRIVYYESGRGCPFGCSYCLSSVDRCVRYRSLGPVFDELQFFIDHKVAQVKFVDRTFNCNAARTKAIWRFITERDQGVTNFHFEVSADLLDAEELGLIAQMRPGLIQLEIGVQSTNPDTLDAIGRHADLERLKGNIAAIKSYGNVHQHLDLIAGLPYEDIESFRRSFNDVFRMQPSQLQLGFLKVLKGTRMESEFESFGGIHTAEPPYEVLATKWLDYDDILRLKRVEEMVEVYYNSGQFLRTIPRLMGDEEPFIFFDRLGDFYVRNGLFGAFHNRLKRYEILMDFAREHCCKVPEEELKELAAFDLFARENLKNRPLWAADQSRYKDLISAMYKSLGKEKSRSSHIEVFTRIFGDEPCAVYFDYTVKDPLTGNCLWSATSLTNSDFSVE